MGVSPREVLFTSGATEALSLAILGVAAGLPTGKRTILVNVTEHKAALAAADQAARLFGARVVRVPVGAGGRADLQAWSDCLDDSVGLAVMMLVNNETGVVGQVREVADRAHGVGALVLSDVTQAIGKIEVDLSELGVDAATLSGHKFYGPRGTGALIATREVQRTMVPLMPGGGQEKGLRGGTPNVPSLVAMGVAAELAAKETKSDIERISALSDRLSESIVRFVPSATIVAADSPRVPSTICVRFRGADSEEVLAGLRSTEVSAGSACSAGSPTPSHVLTAMGFDATSARECIRISLGRPTTWADCAVAIEDIASAVAGVRARESGGTK